MLTYQDDVRKFMVGAGQPVRDTPTVPEWVDKRTHRLCAASVGYLTSAHEFAKIAADTGDERALSIRLLLEEVLETVKALVDGDHVQVLDGVVDTTYIAVGVANRFGYDFDAGWREVQRSNLSKFDNGVAVLDAAGKVVKSDRYSPADIEGVISGRISSDEARLRRNPDVMARLHEAMSDTSNDWEA